VPPPLEAPPLAAGPRGVPPPYIMYPILSNTTIQCTAIHSIPLTICLQSDVEDDADFMKSFSFSMDGSVLSGMIIVPTTSITNCLCIYF
jgi:hypothetical protein